MSACFDVNRCYSDAAGIRFSHRLDERGGPGDLATSGWLERVIDVELLM